MSLNLTEEQILNLAPDAGSVKSSKELANPSTNVSWWLGDMRSFFPSWAAKEDLVLKK